MPGHFRPDMNEINTGRWRARSAGYSTMRNGWKRTRLNEARLNRMLSGQSRRPAPDFRHHFVELSQLQHSKVWTFTLLRELCAAIAAARKGRRQFLRAIGAGACAKA